MSPPGRPKGEYRSAQHEGRPIRPPGSPKGEYRSAQREGGPNRPPGRPKGEYRSAQHEGSPLRARRCLRRLLLAALIAAPAFAAWPAPGPTLPEKDWNAIRQVIDDQLSALKAGDGARALAFAAPGIRAQFGTPENFLRIVRSGYAPLLDARYQAFLDGAVIDGATIQPLRLVMPDSTVLVALYQMQRQPDGRWRIAGCVIAPSTVQAT
jgi:hypothetical protein